jgi:ERI1 exoribonuclease 3
MQQKKSTKNTNTKILNHQRSFFFSCYMLKGGLNIQRSRMSDKPVYVCVLDFEATCWEHSNNHEIIEFPSVLLQWNGKDVKEVSRIQIYVKPKRNPVISEFCEKLTGITQQTIDQGVSLKNAVWKHHEWLVSHTDKENVTILTCGEWDLRTMLPMDLKSTGLKAPSVYKRFVNVKDLFHLVTKKGKLPMVPMLNHFQLKLEGRHHSGIDDCHNIARLFMELVKMGLTTDQFSSHLVTLGT